MPKAADVRLRGHASVIPQLEASNKTSAASAGIPGAGVRSDRTGKAPQNRRPLSVVERFDVGGEGRGQPSGRTISEVLERQQDYDFIGGIEVEETRSPSPQSSLALQLEIDSDWSEESREAFRTMTSAPGYVNRYRLSQKKETWFANFLQDPFQEPLMDDGTRDHQTRYQAARWTLMNGRLYRKPDSSRLDHYRRHLNAGEVWDAIASEHVRQGHIGRDKLRKALDRRYIGYSPQEIMFVLKGCRRCGGKGRYEIDTASTDIGGSHGTVDEHHDGATKVGLNSSAEGKSQWKPVAATGPYARKQDSNFMLYY